MNYTLPLESDEITTGFIMRSFHIMKQTLVEDNVRHAFVQLGLRYNTDMSTYTLLFDGPVLRESPGFTALWQRDDPLEKLSQRRQNAIFGWLTRRCVRSRIVESKHPLTICRDTDHYSFTSQMPIARDAL
jgi:hypothetical protein